MQTTTTTTLALVAMLAMAGIGMMPAQAQVDPDCDDEFTITSTVDQRDLKIEEDETGLVEVPASTTMKLTVELITDTPGTELSFGIFDDHLLFGCITTSNSPDCDDDQKVDPTNPVRVCELVNDTSGSSDFFNNFVNSGLVDLDYEVSIDTV